MRKSCLIAALLLPGAALAEPQLSLTLPLAADAGVSSFRYQCEGGAPFTVRYINSGENRLALVPIEGETLVFVNTVSASGARYVAGLHEWWSRGEDALLGSLIGETPQVECRGLPQE